MSTLLLPQRGKSEQLGPVIDGVAQDAQPVRMAAEAGFMVCPVEGRSASNTSLFTIFSSPLIASRQRLNALSPRRWLIYCGIITSKPLENCAFDFLDRTPADNNRIVLL
jgi:hypothetical protein